MYNSFKSIFQIGITILLVTMLFSCNKKEELPKDLIPKEKMSTILRDVHMAEASLQMFSSKDRDSIARKYYGHIFRIHKIEETKYYESIEHYTRSPEDIIEIYTKTNELLQKKNDEAEKEKLKKEPKG